MAHKNIRHPSKEQVSLNADFVESKNKRTDHKQSSLYKVIL